MKIVAAGHVETTEQPFYSLHTSPHFMNQPWCQRGWARRHWLERSWRRSYFLHRCTHFPRCDSGTHWHTARRVVTQWHWYHTHTHKLDYDDEINYVQICLPWLIKTDKFEMCDNILFWVCRCWNISPYDFYMSRSAPFYYNAIPLFFMAIVLIKWSIFIFRLPVMNHCLGVVCL